jgi:hypothetical protein
MSDVNIEKDNIIYKLVVLDIVKNKYNWKEM